jgi:enterochelin esterase-like enzyme
MPSVIEQQLLFTLADPTRAFARVGLDCDDAIPGPRRFRHTSAGWQLAIPRPEVARLEYRLVVTLRGGVTDVICDPDNAERVQTAFGDRSVALMPGYRRPGWMRRRVRAGSVTSLVHTDARLGELPIHLWSPAGLAPDAPAQLLLVNDGPEYAELASLTRYAAVMQADGTLPAFRMALMQPVQRDEWYAASPRYLAACGKAMDAVAGRVATEPGLVAMGASLGGLAAVLLAVSDPERFVAAFSQSGSFFRPALDPQEASYPFFDRVAASVDALTRRRRRPRNAEQRPGQPVQIALTCGELEENMANNRAVADALRAAGHDVAIRTLPDLHNYTAWRDGLHPSLTALLQSVWALPG